MILFRKFKNSINKLSGFICLFTDNFSFKQSTLWYIKIIKALHDLCETIDYAQFYSNDSTMQTTISLIHSKMIETGYEDTTQTTTFWILAETFYIPSTLYNFNNQFIGWNGNFSVTVYIWNNSNNYEHNGDTTFWILAKNIHAYHLRDYNVNNQFVGLRQKLWFHCAQMK